MARSTLSRHFHIPRAWLLPARPRWRMVGQQRRRQLPRRVQTRHRCPDIPRQTPQRNRLWYGYFLVYAIREVILISQTLAPISSPRTQSPITFKEHALGLMVPSAPVDKEERRATPLRAGKLNLCNYAPPTCRPTPSILLPSSTMSPPSPTTDSPLGSRSSSGEESASPASSTLSTPPVSPTIIPRIIVGGHPATSNERDDDAITYTKQPVHIADWAWSAPGKSWIEDQRNVDLVPGSEPIERRDVPPLRERLSASNAALYNAFVTQWCFAQGPSPSHHVYDGGGIMI